MIDNVNGKPQVASADTGYWSSANVTAENLQGIDLYVATERQQHGETKDVPVDALSMMDSLGPLHDTTAASATLLIGRFSRMPF